MQKRPLSSAIPSDRANAALVKDAAGSTVYEILAVPNEGLTIRAYPSADATGLVIANSPGES